MRKLVNFTPPDVTTRPDEQPKVCARRSNVSNVQLNAVIRRVGESEEWGGAYQKVVGTEGIPPGSTTKPIVLRSNLGYTGIEPRAQMLKNSQFVDAHVQVFAKHGGNQWTKLGEWQIAREMLTQ